MQRLVVSALALFFASFSVGVSHATKFSVLLSTPDEPAVYAVNPLFQGSGTNGTNPIHNISALILDPTELWQTAPATLEVLFDDSLPGDLPVAPAGALVFGVSLFDQATGNSFEKLRGPVTLAMEFNKAIDAGNYIFSSLDESTGVWGEFQKGKPKQGRDNLVCGTTDHFSYFYIAAVPEPSTFALVMLAGGSALAVGRCRERRHVG